MIKMLIMMEFFTLDILPYLLTFLYENEKEEEIKLKQD